MCSSSPFYYCGFWRIFNDISSLSILFLLICFFSPPGTHSMQTHMHQRIRDISQPLTWAVTDAHYRNQLHTTAYRIITLPKGGLPTAGECFWLEINKRSWITQLRDSVKMSLFKPFPNHLGQIVSSIGKETESYKIESIFCYLDSNYYSAKNLLLFQPTYRTVTLPPNRLLWLSIL